MALVNLDITISTAGLPLTGFTFAILGALDEATGVYAKREQGNNPKFTKDAADADLVSGVIYQLTATHPIYEPDGQLIRGSFAADATFVPVDPVEVPVPALTPGTDLPIQLTDPQPGDVLTPVLNPDSGLVELQNARLYTLFPELEYGLGLAVTLDITAYLDEGDFDPNDFDTGQPPTVSKLNPAEFEPTQFDT